MKVSVCKSLCVCLLLVFCVSATAVFAAQPININKASAAELVALKGVGEKTALSIVEYRELHGDFKTTAEIVNVKGVGEKTFAKLVDQITVGEQTTQK